MAGGDVTPATPAGNSDTLFDLWTSRLSCDDWTNPIGAHGVPYGRAPEGQWITCRRCQGQRKVVETIPFGEVARAGLVLNG